MGLVHLNDGERAWGRVFREKELSYHGKRYSVAKPHINQRSHSEVGAVTERLAKPGSPEYMWGSQGGLHKGEAAYVLKRLHTE